MGLFSTLASTTTSGGGQAGNNKAVNAEGSSSSATIPTVIQLYTNNKPMLLENTPKVNGYTTMTYQAVQVGMDHTTTASGGQYNNNPDLGVWNIHVKKRTTNITSNSNTNEYALVDSLLAKVTSKASAYCWVVDLSDEYLVEPTMSLLHSTLVRHLIEHPPQQTDDNTIDEGEKDMDPATMDATTNAGENRANIKTTSLFDLQSNQFGLASGDMNPVTTEQSIEESTKEIKVCLMICAVLPSASSTSTTTEDVTSAETTYKKKQALALLIYHLRKYANAVNASLCFVNDESVQKASHENTDPSSSLSPTKQQQESTIENKESIITEETQPGVSYNILAQLLRDLAMGIPVWQTDNDVTTNIVTSSVGVENENPDGTVSTTTTATTTALYGPGKQQEDLIETVLLRNANYPGHWDANKDSVWVALPTPTEITSTLATTNTGDDGWLTQLRNSIASALPADITTSKSTEETKEETNKPKEKDVAVSSFFESLLKNP